MAEVNLQRLNKMYGDVHAVKDVDLTISDEEFVVLVGPSGCGKSTTLRMLAGLEAITSGVVRIGDRMVNDLPPRDRDIAMVFQNYALYQHMTVYDNLAFGLRNRKVPEARIKEEIDRAVAILGIGELLSRKPLQLSGGQQQRVALGRCIVRHPQVFLFDEPLSNLDAKLRAQMRLEIKYLRERVSTTSVYVTHDQVEAMTLGDRVVVMYDGRIQQVGTPLEIYNAPCNLFVAGFIGSPAMNFAETTVELNGQGLYVQRDGMCIRVPDHQRQGLEPYRDRTVVMGVRPEHLLLGESEGAPETTFDARVEVTEQLGSEQQVGVRVGETQFIVSRVDPIARFRLGESLPISVHPRGLQFFDPETQAAIRGADDRPDF